MRCLNSWRGDGLVLRYTQVVVLCEDRQQEVFARHFLVNCGINRRRIRVNIAPRGRGAGEQHVRAEYPREVREHRARRNQINIALAVLIDADVMSVDARLGQLKNELAGNSLPGRQPDEKIGIVVPKRNIETWIHYLMGKTVNEDDVYSKLEKEGACKPRVAELAGNCREHRPLPEDAPGSLKAACGELARIL